MNTFKHTPGPWTTQDGNPRFGDDWIGVYADDAPDHKMPAMCYGPEREANARLIAAAPIMLEALRDIALAPCACIPPDFPGEDAIICHGCIARAAIAKAEGDA